MVTTRPPIWCGGRYPRLCPIQRAASPNPVAAMLAILRLSGPPSAKARSRTSPVWAPASFQKNRNARLTISSTSCSSVRRASGGTAWDCRGRLLAIAGNHPAFANGKARALFAIRESTSRRVMPVAAGRTISPADEGVEPFLALANAPPNVAARRTNRAPLEISLDAPGAPPQVGR